MGLSLEETFQTESRNYYVVCHLIVKSGTTFGPSDITCMIYMFVLRIQPWRAKSPISQLALGKSLSSSTDGTYSSPLKSFPTHSVPILYFHSPHWQTTTLSKFILLSSPCLSLHLLLPLSLFPEWVILCLDCYLCHSSSSSHPAFTLSVPLSLTPNTCLFLFPLSF